MLLLRRCAVSCTAVPSPIAVAARSFQTNSSAQVFTSSSVHSSRCRRGMAAVASSAAAARNLMTAGGKQGKGKADKLEVEDDEAVELLTSDEEEEQEASGLEEEEEEDEPARKKTAKKKAGAGAGPSKAPRAPRGAKAAAAAAAAAGGPYFNEQERKEIRAALLLWYDKVHRVLPWRRTPHSTRTIPAPAGPHEAAEPAPADLPPQQFGYFVWVSEIMLQQTQVATVIPYFTKWVAKWPTVTDLAGATVEEVNAMWAGLGYYRRARYLLDGAKHVMGSLGGKLPETAKGLLSIPGVGPYTSAAIGSIAFNDAAAVVDGNVIRVVSRLRALPGDPTKLGQVHAAMAAEMLDTDRPGDFNQAVMELGATVCKPAAPDCGSCPVSANCRAHQEWQAYLAKGGVPDIEDAPKVTRFPGKKEVKEKREMAVAACVLEVLHPKAGSAAGAGPEVKSEEGGDKAAGAGAAGAGAPPPRKKQRSMFDFVKSPAAGTSGSSGAGAATAGAVSGASGAGEGAPKEASYVLVKRPEGGLLAGLWEFPGVVFDGTLSYAQRKSLMDAYLESTLGIKLAQGGSTGTSGAMAVRVTRRHDMGQYVHVFSHIKQTNHVERVTVEVEDLAALQAAVEAHQAARRAELGDGAGAGAAAGTKAAGKAGPKKAPAKGGKGGKGKASGEGEEEGAGEGQGAVPDLRWIRGADMGGAALTTGPSRIFALACGEPGGGAKGKGGKGKAS